MFDRAEPKASPNTSRLPKDRLYRGPGGETPEASFGQEDFGSKRAASFGPFRVIEMSPEGQKEVLIKESKKDPLMAKDMRFVCSLFMPGAAGHLLACLLGNGVIHDKKKDRMGFDPQMMEELGQSDLCDLFHAQIFCPRNRVKLERDRRRKGYVRDWTIEEVWASLPD